MAVSVKTSGDIGISSEGWGSKVGLGESFYIDIIINSRGDVSFIERFTEEVQELGKAKDEEAKKFKGNKEAVESSSDSLRKAVSPIRSVSWDLLLLGRSLSIMNTNLFNSNETLKMVTTSVYTIGAAMRILVTVIDMYRVAQSLSAMTSAASVGANQAEAASIWNVVQAKAANLSLSGPAGWAILGIGAGIAGAAIAYYASMQSRIGGGYIPQTGPYLLHKGETVLPAGEESNVININMRTGPISSSVDVDTMLDAMAQRMLQEKRRRGVR